MSSEDNGEPTEDQSLDLPMESMLEAVLMIADEPLSHLTLAQAIGKPPAAVESALASMSASYTNISPSAFSAKS